MTGNGLVEFMLMLASALAGVPLVLDRDWVTAVAVPAEPGSGQEWITGAGAYESLVAGGVRALIDRSPMRYDAAIFLGGAP